MVIKYNPQYELGVNELIIEVSDLFFLSEMILERAIDPLNSIRCIKFTNQPSGIGDISVICGISDHVCLPSITDVKLNSSRSNQENVCIFRRAGNERIIQELSQLKDGYLADI